MGPQRKPGRSSAPPKPYCYATIREGAGETKYVIVIADGMADYPVPELGNRTPLEYARTPSMDRLARQGLMGTVATIPRGLAPGSDVANLAIMGYDPRRYYTGRAPLEAASLGIDLDEADVVYRCNLVTLDGNGDYTDKIMLDHSADEISTPEAGELLLEVRRRAGGNGCEFYPGVSYRHVMVWRQGEENIATTAPHDILDQAIGPYLPRGARGQVLMDMMRQSHTYLPLHPVNRARLERGLRAANSIWLWGQGRKPRLPAFAARYGLAAAVVSAVDLVKGLGLCLGLEVVEVPGATGNINTNFTGKARAALEQLAAGKDLVYLHVEAPDEAGHRGELGTKIMAIEEIDSRVVGEVVRGLEGMGEEFRLLVMPDHFTPLSRRTHVADPVPFVLYDSTRLQDNGARGFTEVAAAASGLKLPAGHLLIRYLIGGGH